MRKIWIGLAAGGAIGAGLGVALAKGDPGDEQAVRQRALAAGGGLAATGALVGLILDRRSRRARAVPTARELLADGELLGAAKVFAPVALEAIQSAASAGRREAEQVAGGVVSGAQLVARGAGPRVSHAVEVARPRVEHAVEVARPRVEHAVEVARPRVEHAVEALSKAHQAAEALSKAHQAAGLAPA